MKVKKWVADFETTTDPNNCYVWAYACCEVGNHENVVIGTSLEDFISWCMSLKTNDKIFFHNLKFDCQFIIDYLLREGFKHVEDKKELDSKTFTTLISDKGLYYAVDVVFKKTRSRVKRVIFQDSLKLIPLSVDQIAKTFKLPISKLKIDYDAHNGLPPGTPLSEEEKDYIVNDVKIVAYAIDFFHKQGLNKMTIGACALNEYKELISKRYFKNYFPEPRFHEDVKQSYRGGFTYLNPKFANKTVGPGIVLDVNSLYPSVMYENYLPYGEPIFFWGKYEHDDVYSLYTQMFRCSFKLKKGKIPTVQLKCTPGFRGNEYLTSSKDEEVTMCLNSVDLELFFQHYDVFNIEYLSGWKFKKTRGLFKNYIDKWSNEKIKAKEEGNPGMYYISKLFLNSLYGKFGTDTKVKSKVPYIDPEDNALHYKDGKTDTRPGIYVAIASFITSWARLKTISSAQKIMDDYNAGKSKIQFIYADTDSLHCLSPNLELPQGLDIDSTKLGAWDHEMSFQKGRYLRQKCYIENELISEKDYLEGLEKENAFLYNKDKEGFYKLKITVAGMPSGCYNQVTFDNFNIGASYTGKKVPKLVKGGCVLNDVDFTIK